MIGAVAPSDKVLWLHGPLLAASLGILGVSILRIFAPCPLTNILAVYGATFIYAGRTLTDTAVMVDKAKTQTDEVFNPEIHAIGLYLDMAIVFLQLCRLFAGAGGSGAKPISCG
jgi:FtsH-binding integral membrane protein